MHIPFLNEGLIRGGTKFPSATPAAFSRIPRDLDDASKHFFIVFGTWTGIFIVIVFLVATICICGEDREERRERRKRNRPVSTDNGRRGGRSRGRNNTSTHSDRAGLFSRNRLFPRIRNAQPDIELQVVSYNAQARKTPAGCGTRPVQSVSAPPCGRCGCPGPSNVQPQRATVVGQISTSTNRCMQAQASHLPSYTSISRPNLRQPPPAATRSANRNTQAERPVDPPGYEDRRDDTLVAIGIANNLGVTFEDMRELR